jgi:PKD repeat protein
MRCYTLKLLFSIIVAGIALCAGFISSSVAEPLGAVEVSGNAYLEGEADHSGILVVFEAASPSAVSDSAVTSTDGSFALLLQTGIYDIEYRKAGYATNSEYGVLISGATVLDDVTLASESYILTGDISGTLTGGSVYYVDSDVTIQNGDTLIIEPGVTLKFRGYYYFQVLGLLLAQGTVTDSITFTSNETVPAPGDWNKIEFYDASDDNSVLDYCRIEFGYEGVYIDNAAPLISNCFVEYASYHGIDCYFASPTISHCRVEDCGNTGINCSVSSGPVTGCTVDNCDKGIYLYNVTDAYVDGCFVTRCGNPGLRIVYGVNGIVSNCTFDNNTEGIYTNLSSTNISRCVFKNNLIAGISTAFSTPFTIERCLFIGEDTGIYIGDNDPSVVITSNIFRDCVEAISSSQNRGTFSLNYNDFYNNGDDFWGDPSYFPTTVGQLITTNVNGDSCDTYFNIFKDPLQVDPVGGDYNLTSGSPCIDAGDPSLATDNDGTIADIGPYYYHQGSPPPAPAADFSASPLSGYAPLPVVFTDLSTGAINSYVWNFGDGRISTQQNPGHYYTEPDTYTVTLTVSGPVGSDMEVKTDYIIVLPDMSPPQAEFVASPTSGYAPLEVTFVNLIVGEVDSVMWYFGDGDSSSTLNPVHVYSSPDTLDVRLVAYGPYGSDEEIKTEYIKVQETPPILAEFSANPLGGVAPVTVTFTDESLGLIDTWKWHFGDGDSSEVANPIHVYNDPGLNAVSLTVDGPGGQDTETKTGYIHVCLEEAVIDSIVDVPDDQGGWAYLHFTRSGYDFTAENETPVTSYFIYRRIDSYATALAIAEQGTVLDSPVRVASSSGGINVLAPSDGRLLIDYNGRTYMSAAASDTLPAGTWAVVGSVPAHQESNYTALVATIADSATTFDYSVYCISAETVTPSIYFISGPDSGYSVDNLPPSPPLGLAGTPSTAPDGLEIDWESNTENDFSHYAVYRGTDEGFVPGPGNIIASPLASFYFDSEWTYMSGYYYKVVAVDVHENESGFALLSPDDITTGDTPHLPGMFFLAQNVPNPFNPATTIKFTIKERSHVHLKIYDTLGRLIRVLVDDEMSAGVYERIWTGSDAKGNMVSSGVYFCRLAAGGFVQTRKMVLLR